MTPTRERSGYGAGAKILSIGIASTGVVTFAYFSVASYALNDIDYKAISLLWSVLFVIVSVIYRPIEQLLSRTIAGRRARGLHTGHPLRTPLLIQAGFALAFLVIALAFKGPIENDLFDGSAALYWVLVVAVLAYAASYFARGWLAGHQWFGFYGALVFMEATSRLLFAVAVAIGIASGQTAVALGMAAAPFVSLVVVPWAFSRRPKTTAPKAESDEESLGLARGGRFAVAVLCIMIAEQTLLNGGVLMADFNATDAAVAGYVFNALLIARAPLQLFQAVQGSLLPHLAGLEATEGRARVQQGDPDHDPRHRRLRGRRGARAADPRPVRDERPLRRRRVLRALRPGRGGDRDGRPPRGRHAQPGRARPRPRRRRRPRPGWSAPSSSSRGCCSTSSTTH